MCQQQMDKLRRQCDQTVKNFLDLEQKFIEKEKEQHEYSWDYNEILRNQRLTHASSEKDAEETSGEPVLFQDQDVDDDLTPLDESKGVGAKGDPHPEPLPDPFEDRTALVFGSGKGNQSAEKYAACGFGSLVRPSTL